MNEDMIEIMVEEIMRTVSLSNFKDYTNEELRITYRKALEAQIYGC